MHILWPLTNSCSSWISESGRMALEFFSWPSRHERMCRTWGTDSRPLACQADTLPIELPRPASNVCERATGHSYFERADGAEYWGFQVGSGVCKRARRGEGAEQGAIVRQRNGGIRANVCRAWRVVSYGADRGGEKSPTGSSHRPDTLPPQRLRYNIRKNQRGRTLKIRQWTAPTKWK